MKFSTVHGIHKDKIESKLYARYRGAITELQRLGFGHLDYVREAGFPLSAVVTGWLVYPQAWMTGDFVGVSSGLQLVIYYPLLMHAGRGTYVIVTKKSVTFSTMMEDETVVQTASVVSKTPVKVDEERRFYRFAMPRAQYPQQKQAPIDATWKLHQARLDDAIADGHAIDMTLSFETFAHISEVSDRVALEG